MRIAIVNNQAPFVRGGAELLAEWLASKLREHGHQSEIVRLPFSWRAPQHIVEGILAARLVELPNVDRVIALKFPAYLIRHPIKVLWLLHQFRQAYELRGTQLDELSRHDSGSSVAEMVRNADNAFLGEAQRIFTNSSIVSQRLSHYNGLRSEVLFPPLLTNEGYACAEYGRFVFAPSRLSDGKRQALLIEAMTHVRSDVGLVIAGSPDHESDLVRLRDLIDARGIGSRVRLMGSWISEEEKQRLFAYALACAYVPYDEDSYGYVTLESYHSRKPVITCSDSGGTLELVEDDVTGVVTEPHPQALAEEMDRLYADTSRARRLGEAGYARMQSLNISWDHVIERLLA